MAFEYRDATLEDAAFAADVYSAAHPAEPLDPLMTRYEWQNGYAGWTYDRRIATRDGRPVGFAETEIPAPGATPKRFAFIRGEPLP